MTSTRDQVIRLLTEKVKTSPRLTLEIVDTLAAEDCLRADLPEPSRRSKGYHAGHPWLEWGDNQVNLTGSLIDVPHQFALDATETRELAYYLLAAADHMEKNA